MASAQLIARKLPGPRCFISKVRSIGTTPLRQQTAAITTSKSNSQTTLSQVVKRWYGYNITVASTCFLAPLARYGTTCLSTLRWSDICAKLEQLGRHQQMTARISNHSNPTPEPGYIGVMEKKVETTTVIGYILGLYRANGKENGNYC